MKSRLIVAVAIVVLGGAMAYHLRAKADLDALHWRVATLHRVIAELPALEREHQRLQALQIPEAARTRLRADHEALERLRREVEQLAAGRRQ